MQTEEPFNLFAPSLSSPNTPLLSTEQDRWKTLATLKKRNVAGLSPLLPLDANLDANMKKNITFVKKLKMINAENITSILNDLNKLKLEKYLAEIITSILENFSSTTRKLVTSDFDPILHCVSAFHLRFRSQFTPAFVEATLHTCILKPCSNEKDEKDRIQKGKLLVRFITDLYLIGVFHPIPPEGSTRALPTPIHPTTDEGSPSKKTSSAEKKSPAKSFESYYGKFFQSLLLSSHENLPLLTVLLKFYHPLFVSHPESFDPLDGNLTLFYKPTKLYFEKQLLPTLNACHQRHLRLGHKTNEWYYERGNLAPEELKSSAEMAQKQFDHLHGLAKMIAGYMDWELPKFEETNEEAVNKHGEITLHVLDKSTPQASLMYEDEEQRQFYQDLPDLHSLLLPNLSEESLTDQEAITIMGLLSKLTQCTSTHLVDQLALDFCRVATKSSHGKLAKELLESCRGRHDLLPYYARLLAILKDLAVFPMFMEEFESILRRHIKSTNANLRFATRYLMIRYLSELVKFQLVPDHVLFYVLKSMLDYFTPFNIELFCNFIEECGRFLHLHPRTQPRLLELLERLSKLKKKINDTRLEILVESALLSISPQYASPPKQRSPDALYIMHLLDSLNMKNLKSVAQKLCKYPWPSPDTLMLMCTRLTKLKRVKFHQVEALACVVFIVTTYHPELGVQVIDTLIEKIQVGLEQNHLRDHQLRILHMVYLAYFLKVNLIQEDLLFKILEYILAFPVNDGPAEFFRIRLVLSALNVCWKRLNPERLDRFLVVFQFYISCKNRIPIDLNFALDDLFESMRPGSHRLSMEEAYEELQTFMEITPPPPPSSTSQEPEQMVAESAAVDSEEEILRQMDLALHQLQMEAPSKSRKKRYMIEVPETNGHLFSKGSHATTVSVLTRKGNKAVTKELKIEQNSLLGQHVQRVVEEAENEHRHLKMFVLKYEKREQKERMAAELAKQQQRKLDSYGSKY